ncbi:DUF4037 domain-containing protein [Hominifimenecus sp. rT4P-3]|uniref:DUF4037 domain-containing protein n=1 Tax=Hominifimenecus sp. rT4P-3 TaxID=3242979 RepID=UPI003DA6137E
MKGLELAKAYYEVYGKPMIQEKFPEYQNRIAAGLVGQGSECLGFDDAISTDHDFGPSFCLWLTDEDYLAIGNDLQDAYDSLPKDYLGVSGRITSARGGGRVGVLSIRGFYGQFIGKEQPPSSLARWLALPEYHLASAVNGQVFEDPLGEFSAIRNALLSYYPEDVRIKKIAARAAAMAQSGQYNYARCMRRGETVAAELAVAEFLRAAVSMVYLLNKKYTPFYKWMFHGMKDLPILAPIVAPMILELAELGIQKTAWENQDSPRFNPYVNRMDRKVQLIESICGKTIRELHAQGFTTANDDFLEAHVDGIMERIQDPEIRQRHILEG